jgi:DNA polymerase I-like protein with 3'-5' exonuclease and polymerase domains
MLHPAALLRNPKDTYGVIEVLHRVTRVAESGVVPPDSSYGARHCISPYHPMGPDGALGILEEVVDRVIRERQEIAVDVETTTEMPRTAALTIFGFATYADAYAVTIIAWNKQRQCFEECWTEAQAARRDAIIRRLLNANLAKWAWNYSFDKTVCERDYGTDDNWHDGLHWHWLIQPELDHHLNFAVQSWLSVPPWKANFWAKQNAGEADHDDLSLYNCDDDRYTIHLVPHLRQHAAERQVHVNHEGFDLVAHQMRVSELARRAELYGVPIHRKTALELREKHAKRIDELVQQMRDSIVGHEEEFAQSVYRQRYRDAKDRARKTGKFNQPDYRVLTANDFNPNSPHHARWFLFEFLKLKSGRWTGGGAEKDESAKRLSTSYKGILNYLGHPDVGDLVRAYVDHSEEDYRVKHLIDPVLRKAEDDPEHPDWMRLYVSWNTEGTKGTRWTSKLVNLQNWQKAMRKILRARPGRVWVGADAAQLEYRISAALAGLEELIKLFNQPEFDEEMEPWKKFDGEYDAHSLVAEEVYGNDYRAQSKEFTQCMQWLIRTTGHDAPTILHWKAGDVPEQARAVWKRAKAAKKLLSNWRTMVKRVVYALFYGARPAKILVTIQEDRRVPVQMRATLTEERITRIWEGFKRRFPEWDRWAMREMDNALSKGYQTFPPLWRKRYWTQKEVEEQKIRNTPIQLSAGDIVNIIFLRVQDRIDAEGLDSVLSIHGHDAGYYDTLEAHAERVRDIYNEEFHMDLPGPAGSVHIYGQAVIGPTVADVG